MQRVARREEQDGEGDEDMGEVVEEEERMNEEAAAGRVEPMKQAEKSVDSSRRKQGNTGNQTPGGKKQKSGGGKGKPRPSAVAMDVD